jgi:hypothetical protein
MVFSSQSRSNGRKEAAGIEGVQIRNINQNNGNPHPL